MYNKILVIDGSYYLNRCLSIPRFFDMINQNGNRIGGVYGFLTTLNSDISKHPLYFPIITFDKGLNPRRLQLYPDYKHNLDRQIAESVKLTDEEKFNNFGIQYKIQRNILSQLLPCLGIPVIMVEDYEGDDLIYLITRLAKSSIIMTEDRDMWQLVSDKCQIYLPKQKQYIDTNYINLNYSSVSDFILRKVILGDKSDNIQSSCKGIGEKSVNDFIKLIKLFNRSLLEDDYSFIEYPSTEKRMKDFCLDHNIPYKKAYLNFDENIFLVNLELINLNRLILNDTIKKTITDPISNCRLNIDEIKARTMLTNLGIREKHDIDISKIVSNVSKSYLNLYNNNSLF